MTMKEEQPRVENNVNVVEESNNGSDKTTFELSSPYKPKSEVTRATEGSLTTNNDSDLVDTPSVSSAQSDHRNVSREESNEGTNTTTFESSPLSKSKSKGAKRKKKKSASNKNRNSPEFLSVFNEESGGKKVNVDESSNRVETTTVISSTSSKPKSKGARKKKKKPNINDDGDSIDLISVSSAKSGHTGRNKSSPRKKKKKKVVRDGETLDVTRECSTRSGDAAEDDKSLMTNSVKSTNKTKIKSMKSKKKKAKSSNENKPSVPSIERTKSLEQDRRTNVNMKRRKSLDPGQPSDSIVRRSMSLDASANQFRSTSTISSGRLNSQRENGMNGHNWTGRGRAQGGRGRGSPNGGRGRGRGRAPLSDGWGAPRPQRPPERSYSQERTIYDVRSSSQERIPYSRSASQERSPYGARSVSQERSPYANSRAANGRGSNPSPRGRRRMSFPQPSTSNENSPVHSKSSRGNHILQSKPSRGNIYRAPSRPKSILRNSSHHGMLHGSSHHRNDRSIATSSSHSSSQYNQRRHVSMDLNAGSRHSYMYDPHASFGSGIDSSDVESDEEDDISFAMEDSGKKYERHVPRTVVKGYSRTLSGLGINSSHHANHLKAVGQSARSLLTIEQPEYQNENRFIRTLRYIRVMAPYPNEDPIKKKIRIVTWMAFFFDFLNSLVALITYGGETTKCCGESLMSAFGGDIDWDKAILIITCMYMFLIFLEIVPVMRDAFPFNLLNPAIGFLITFAVFFSDSITEAAIMWAVEAMAVGCEVVNYRLRGQRFNKRKARLKKTKKEIENLRKIKRKVKNQFDSGGGKILARADSSKVVLDLNDSSSFAEDSSFFDDIETQHNSGDANTVASRTAITTVSNIGTARETRLLRDRRQLIRSQAEDERDLRYHFMGVCINVFLVVFALLMIVIIAKNGGMCIENMRFGNIFKNDQLLKCDKCNGEEVCERCNGENKQCYYPYGIGM